MVIFHSYVKLPEGNGWNPTEFPGRPDGLPMDPRLGRQMQRRVPCAPIRGQRRLAQGRGFQDGAHLRTVERGWHFWVDNMGDFVVLIGVLIAMK